MIWRPTKRLFLLISTCIAISFTSASPQCCPPGFSLNPDRVRCVSGDKEVQVEGLDMCKGDQEVVEARYTKLSYHGSKLGHRRSYNILHFNIQACCTAKQPFPLVSSACLAWLPLCSSCLSGLCIQQCCPPGQVRREDQAWRQARCIRGQGGQITNLWGIFW